MKKSVENFLNEYKLKGEHTFLVGFSGGWDSSCLVDLLHRLGVKLVAVHFNHNWRGKAAKHDEDYCRDFCKTRRIEFYTETASPKIAKTETAAREARYAFFEKCVEKFDAQGIFTAHTKSDNAETLIYRIAKGTGIKGLEGIKECRGNIYRPLLNFSRKDILNYCKKYKINACEDSTNADTTYNRNFIRHEILPRLNKINEKSETALASLASLAADTNEIVAEYLQKIKKEITESGKILTAKFCQLSKPLQKAFICNFLTEQNLDYDSKKIEDVLNFILANSKSKTGKKCSLTKDLHLFVNAKNIYTVTTKKQQKLAVKIEKEGEFEVRDFIFTIKKAKTQPKNFPSDKEGKAFATLSDLKNLVLRTRLEGDVISPLGTGGTMKLKKFLIEKEIPQHLRDEMLFLCKGSEVLWAPYFAVSEKIKVVNSTSHVLSLIKKGEQCHFA